MYIDTVHAQNFIPDMCEPQYNVHAQSLQPYTAAHNVAMPANALFHNLYKDTGNDNIILASFTLIGIKQVALCSIFDQLQSIRAVIIYKG